MILIKDGMDDIFSIIKTVYQSSLQKFPAP